MLWGIIRENFLIISQLRNYLFVDDLLQAKMEGSGLAHDGCVFALFVYVMHHVYS